MDKISKRSKGVAYVEFFSEESVPKAIGMTSRVLLGIPIICSASEAYKNAEAEARSIAAGNIPVERIQPRQPTFMPKRDIVTRRLVVGNLAQSVSENDIRSLFDACGRLDSVKIHLDASTGRSKGFAFVNFRTTNDARFAIRKLHMHVLKGKSIDVKPVEEEEPDTRRTKDLDDGDQGVSLTSLSRVELMSKLARDEVHTSSSRGESRTIAGSSSTNSPCIVLKNMFDVDDPSNSANWENEIRDDVYHECQKFGKIPHIAVDVNSKGFIYLKFHSPDAAERAVSALNGRFFGGRKVAAHCVPVEDYFRLYPKSAQNK